MGETELRLLTKAFGLGDAATLATNLLHSRGNAEEVLRLFMERMDRQDKRVSDLENEVESLRDQLKAKGAI